MESGGCHLSSFDLTREKNLSCSNRAILATVSARVCWSTQILQITTRKPDQHVASFAICYGRLPACTEKRAGRHGYNADCVAKNETLKRSGDLFSLFDGD